MTEQEARDKSDEKVQQIKELADKLQIKITAEQAITRGNIIKSVVYFTDMEEYDIEKPASVAPGPNKLPEGMATHISKLAKKDVKSTLP